MSVAYVPAGTAPTRKRVSLLEALSTGTPTSMSSSADMSLVTMRTNGEPERTTPCCSIHAKTSSVSGSTTPKPSIVTAVAIATYGWASRRVRAGCSDIGSTPRSRAKVSVQALDDHGHALATADAHRLQAEARASVFERIEQCRHDARAGHAEGVTEGDGAAADVEF